jgi:hypothetical protein
VRETETEREREPVCETVRVIEEVKDTVGERETVEETVREGRTETLLNGEALAVPEMICEGEAVPERECCSVTLRCALADGEQVEGVESPVERQPPQGQAMGASLPNGQ